MVRKTARRKSRKSKRRGRKSRRHRGGGVATNASDFSPVNGGEKDAPVEETPGQTGGKRRRRRKGRKSKRGGSCGSSHIGGRRKTRKQKGGKRKLNAYFKAMLAAKRTKAASFKYNGSTYKRVRRGHLDVYKKA